MSPPALSVAPWRSTFLSHIDNLDSQNMVLSTLDITNSSNRHSRSAAEAACVPRARTVIFRGMWASLPVNPKNPADLNPGVYTSDMPTITTDVRMDKVPQLLRDEDACRSGIGGPFEAVLWAAPHNTQWRLRGHVCVIGPDIESDGAAPVRTALEARMRETGETSSSSSSQTWSWSRELTAHFGNLSPGMRGTFRNPPPGSRRSGGAEPGLGLGQKVEDLHDETARKNFRVLVLVPEEVDRVDYSDPKTAQRWNYSLDESGRWVTVELWP